MKIGIHSDLHTEHSLCEISNLSELDLLVLAGDIGNLQTVNILFKKIREKAQNLPILYVLGNHEFYGLHYPGAKEDYRAICKKHNVTLLDNEVYQVGDTVFLGTTLWTNFDLAEKQSESMNWAKYHISDFSEIFNKLGDNPSPFLTPEAMLMEFQVAHEFLLSELKKAKEGALKTVVVSHFLPAFELVSKQFMLRPGGLMRSAYWASDLYELFPFVDYWIYGHSHTNIETQAITAETEFLCNQRGYSRIFNKSESNGYQHDYIVSI